MLGIFGSVIFCWTKNRYRYWIRVPFQTFNHLLKLKLKLKFMLKSHWFGTRIRIQLIRMRYPDANAQPWTSYSEKMKYNWIPVRYPCWGVLEHQLYLCRVEELTRTHLSLEIIEPGTALRRDNQFTSTIVRNCSQNIPTVSLQVVQIIQYKKYGT